MRILPLTLFIFLLSALAVGTTLGPQDESLIHGAINNVSLVIENISFEYTINDSSAPNMNGMFLIVEKYAQFVCIFAIEFMRAGIIFGHDNPQYFNPDFLMFTIKAVIVLVVLSLLIKPIFYLVVLLIMCGIYIKDKLVKRREKKRYEKFSKVIKKKFEGGEE